MPKLTPRLLRQEAERLRSLHGGGIGARPEYEHPDAPSFLDMLNAVADGVQDTAAGLDQCLSHLKRRQAFGSGVRKAGGLLERGVVPRIKVVSEFHQIASDGYYEREGDKVDAWAFIQRLYGGGGNPGHAGVPLDNLLDAIDSFASEAGDDYDCED